MKELVIAGQTGKVRKTDELTYNGENITFELSDGDVMVNATQMAKAFGKRPNDFLGLPSTKELIRAITRRAGNCENQLIITNVGAPEYGGGTWMHRLVAISFAQWLSADFHLICLEKIEELLTTGVATVKNDDEAILHAIQVLQKRVEENKQRVQILEGENEHLTGEVRKLAPKADYVDKVLQSTSTYTTTQVAKELGMSAVTLNKKLHGLNIQFRQSGQWMLYAKYADKGYAKTRTYAYENKKDGTAGTKSETVWTERGRAFIHLQLGVKANQQVVNFGEQSRSEA